MCINISLRFVMFAWASTFFLSLLLPEKLLSGQEPDLVDTLEQIQYRTLPIRASPSQAVSNAGRF